MTDKNLSQNKKTKNINNIFHYFILAFIVCMLSALAFSAFTQQHAFANEESTTNTTADNYDTMYRLYNKYTGEHFYTANSKERTNLVNAGWNDEGIGWYAPTTSLTPVWRLYNSNAPGGDHHYTTSQDEYNTLTYAGWTGEGIGWYSDDNKATALYRQYNPNAQSGTHNYTASTSERDAVVKAGWQDEGIGWYGLDRRTTFAIYSADDKSLSFYKRDTVPTSGTKFGGKTVTTVYTNIASRTADTAICTEDIEIVNFVDKITPTSTKRWFSGKTNLKQINNIENLDTSNVTDMSYMFNYCYSLKSLYLSSFDTKQVKNMSGMFYHCTGLAYIDISKFDTRNVTDMSTMFYQCSSLYTLESTTLDTAKVTKMDAMFYNCSKLNIDCSKWEVSKVASHDAFNYNASGVVAPYWEM